MIKMAVFLIIAFLGCTKEQEIVTRLSEYEANEVLVLLASQKIEAKKSVQEGRQVTYSISVQEKDLKAALALLVANKLPREKSRGLSDVYPPGSSGLIPTKSEERAKYLMAVQGEVENMLKVLPGVMQAKVILVLPDNETLRNASSKPPKPTASVTLVYQPKGEKGSQLSVEQVKQLVASSVEDLTPEGVVVMMSPNFMKVSKQKKVLPPAVPKAQALSAETQLLKDPLFLSVLALCVLGLLFGLLAFMRLLKVRSQLVLLQQRNEPPKET